MLSVKRYSKGYIASCQRKIEADVEIFQSMATSSIEIENAYFNNMVLILETMFMHRMRGQEGKDGNPLNEVRMLTNSILCNDQILLADKTIKYNEAKAVLKIGLGQKIALTMGNRASI